MDNFVDKDGNDFIFGLSSTENTPKLFVTSSEPGSEFDEFFIEENSDYSNLNKLDISEEVKEIRKRYPEIYKFKKVAKLNSNDVFTPFIKYAKDHKDLCGDVVMGRSHFVDQNSYDVPYFEGLSIVDKDFAFICRTNYISDKTFAYLFFNDLQFIKDTFFKKDFTKYKEDIYELGIEKNNYVLHKVNIKNIEEPILEENLSKKLNSDISLFFDNKQFYVDNNLSYKRGIILYGPPGCGKTSVIKKLLTEHSHTHRLLIDCGKYTVDGDFYEYLIKVFPKESKKIIVFEDVEAISSEGSRTSSRRSSFLNFIDGAKTIENTIFIATTNYPDLVDPALINRPSRFDKVYKIDYPSKSCRERFLLRFFPDLKEDTAKLNEYTDLTKDFSGAYFKELFIMVGIQKVTIKDAITALSKQIKMCKEQKFDKEKTLGFGASEDD